jgi:FtsZ-binding cell division protein ZapB
MNRKGARRLVLIWAVVAAFAPGVTGWAAEATRPEDDFRAVLDKWVEARRLISQERQDWRTGRELLEDRIGVVRREVEALGEKITQAATETTEVDRKLADLKTENETFKAAGTAMQAAVAELEGELRTLLAQAPEPLREKVKPLTSRLPQDSANTKMSLAERFQNAIGVLNELTKANGEITLATEIRNLRGDRPAEVKTVYVGLAQAYYVSAGGEAGIGHPTEKGWQWEPANDLAPTITDIIQIMQNKAKPRFVAVPVRIQR